METPRRRSLPGGVWTAVKGMDKCSLVKYHGFTFVAVAPCVFLIQVESSAPGFEDEWQNAVVAGCMFILKTLELTPAGDDDDDSTRTKDTLLALALFVLSNKCCATSPKIQVPICCL